MRDQSIIQQFEQMAAAVSADHKQLGNGQAMLRTRLDALEFLLLGSRVGLLKMAVLQLFSPRLVARMVQAKHSEQIRKFNESRQAAERNRATIKPPPVGLIKAV